MATRRAGNLSKLHANGEAGKPRKAARLLIASFPARSNDAASLSAIAWSPSSGNSL
jgi:hypothetical protein